MSARLLIDVSVSERIFRRGVWEIAKGDYRRLSFEELYRSGYNLTLMRHAALLHEVVLAGLRRAATRRPPTYATFALRAAMLFDISLYARKTEWVLSKRALCDDGVVAKVWGECRVARRWHAVRVGALVVARLGAALRRAAERVYAPGGAGYSAAAASFDACRDRAAVAHFARKRKREDDGPRGRSVRR